MQWNESQAAAVDVEVLVTLWDDISFVNIAIIHGRQDVLWVVFLQFVALNLKCLSLALAI